MRSGLSVRGLMIVGAMLALSASTVRAQSDIAGLFAPWQNESRVEVLGEATIQNAGHDKFSNTLRLSTYESQGRVELMHEHQINPTLGFEAFYLDINGKIPGVLPRRLMDSSVAFATPVAKFGEWFTAVSAGVGYAGDAPLSQSNAYYGRGTILFGRQFEKGQSLLIALDYNGNRAAFADIPLPGFAYSRRINDEIGIVVGAPYSSITWESAQSHLKAKFEYSFPATVSAEVTYPVTKQIGAYGNLRNILTGFHTDALPSNRRIFFEQKRAELGVRWEPSRNFDLVLGGGYGFDTKFETGFDSRDTRNVNRSSDEVYVRLGLEFRN